MTAMPTCLRKRGRLAWVWAALAFLGCLEFTPASHGQAFRAHSVRAIPLQDTRLLCPGAPSPLQAPLTSCALQCVQDAACLAFNHGNASCQLLASYLCLDDGACTLAFEEGTKYYDVDDVTYAYDGVDPMTTPDCQTLGRCSYKCERIVEESSPTASSNTGLEETLSMASGSLSSPGFLTGSYPPSLTSTWTIQALDPTHVIRLTFVTFALEAHSTCMWDYVEVFDGNTTDAAKLLGRYCGTALPAPLTSSQRYMKIQFVSDHVDVYPGFNASFVTFDPNYEVIGSQCSSDADCQVYMTQSKCEGDMCRCEMGFSEYSPSVGRKECVPDCRNYTGYADSFASDVGFALSQNYVTSVETQSGVFTCLSRCTGMTLFECRSVTYDPISTACSLSEWGCADGPDVCSTSSASAVHYTRNCNDF